MFPDVGKSFSGLNT